MSYFICTFIVILWYLFAGYRVLLILYCSSSSPLPCSFSDWCCIDWRFKYTCISQILRYATCPRMTDVAILRFARLKNSFVAVGGVCEGFSQFRNCFLRLTWLYVLSRDDLSLQLIVWSVCLHVGVLLYIWFLGHFHLFKSHVWLSYNSAWLIP